jgi:hypothetical protein
VRPSQVFKEPVFALAEKVAVAGGLEGLDAEVLRKVGRIPYRSFHHRSVVNNFGLLTYLLHAFQ